MKKLTCKMFGGEGEEEYNALMSALQDCAENRGGDKEIYSYLEDTLKTSLIVEMVDALHTFGYKIIKELPQ